MALVDSLLTAMVRADGDALVMHVGERPIVIAGSKTIDLSSHGLNLSAMVGMLGQLLSSDAQGVLREFGAVEHALPSLGEDRFSVVAARGGDDIWIEIRRRRDRPTETLAPVQPADLPAEVPEVPARITEPPAEPAEASAPEPMEAGPSEPVEAPVFEPVEAAVDQASTPTAFEPAPAVEVSGAPTAEEMPTEEMPTEEMPTEEMPADETTAGAPSTSVLASESETVAPIDERPVEPVAEELPAPVLADEVEASAAAPPRADEAPEHAAAAAPADAATGRTVAPVVDEAREQAAAATPAGEAQAASASEPPVAEAPAPWAPELAPDVEPEQVAELQPETAGANDEPMPVTTESPSAVEAAAAATDVASEETTEAVSEESEHQETDREEAQPVPAMASAHAAEHAATELRSAMSYSEATPQSGSPAGGPPASFPPPPAPSDAPSGASSEVTRTVRIEVPERANPARAARIDQLLHAAMAHDVSELFLVSQSRPYIRADGDIRVVADESPLQPADVEALVADLTPEPWKDAVRRGEPAEWLIELPGVGRVRCTTFRDQRGPGAMFRFTAPGVPSAEQMGLGAEAVLLATEPEGLVFVASPAGSDRSAVVAAFVDTINQRRSDYIISVEPEVRTLHQNHHALVSQRQVGHDGARALAAARGALRENPDVLVLEDVTSPDVAALALEAARDERLVIVSVEAPSAATAVQRFVDLLPEGGRDAGRMALAQVFRGALAQLVVRKASGGRVAAREQLSASRDVSAIIAGTDTPNLAAALDARAGAETPLVDVLAGYVRSGSVDVREAFRKAPDPARLLAQLRDAGVDTGAVERLA